MERQEKIVDYLFAHRYTIGIMLGVIFGITARMLMMRTDYRQYPTYPHGKIIHISLGIIAASLGAVAVPAIFNKDYTAVTFLTLAAQQFRDVRNMERETLSKIDSNELVSRGATYIEGIAMVFEGRNYLVIFCSFITALFTIMFAWYYGVIAGICSLVIVEYFKSGKNIATIADVSMGIVRVDGPDVYVDDIYMMNVGLKSSQQIIADLGIGIILKPKNNNSRVTLAHLGQRQAILYDLSTMLGVYRDSGEPSLTPIAKLDLRDGRLAVLVLPVDPDRSLALKVINKVPMLESAVRMPSEAKKQLKGE